MSIFTDMKVSELETRVKKLEQELAQVLALLTQPQTVAKDANGTRPNKK